MSRRMAPLALFLVCAIAPAQAQSDIELEAIEVEGQGAGAGGSKTSPTTAEAKKAVGKTAGSAEVVADTEWKHSPAGTVKDILDFSPGVFVQPKWGGDARLSIRGSGLSRYFHLRGVQLHMDGIPMNTADGSGYFQEIDPSAYRYTEVFRGPSSLWYGANALGGAINFVMPTGRDADRFQSGSDAGSFGYRRLQASSGGVQGDADYFVTGSWQQLDGYRDQSEGDATRGSANIGYQLTPDIETRFYLHASNMDQEIPGPLLRSEATTDPRQAAPNNVAYNWQLNEEVVRFANKTSVTLDNTVVEIGAFGAHWDVEHPIYQFIDYQYLDYGVFAHATDEREIAGNLSRLTAGVRFHGGEVDNKQFENLAGGSKGSLLSSALDESSNVIAYVENSYYVRPDIAVVAGLQFLHAERDRTDRFLADGDQSGGNSYEELSPKIGLLWDVDPDWQVFANIARSAEVPTFVDASSITPFDTRPQTAWTYEVGSRGSRDNLMWDVALYRMHIDNELMCYANAFGNCTTSNADKTVHQGVELGLGVGILEELFSPGDSVWLNTAYAFNDFRFDADATFGDNEIPGAPRHYLRAELMYRNGSGFSIGPNVEWAPEAFYVDSANTTKTDSYALLGLRAVYDNGKHFSAYIEGRNLTDERYFASASAVQVYTEAFDPGNGIFPTRVFEPGEGRGIYGGVKFRW